MHMVMVNSNFQELNFVAERYFFADFFEFLIDFPSKNGFSIFRRADNVIKQDVDIVLFPNELTHSLSIFRSRATGNYTYYESIKNEILEKLPVSAVFVVNLLSSNYAGIMVKDFILPAPDSHGFAL